MNLPEPDPDREILQEALRNRGFQAEWLAWDDPDAEPGRFEVCVLRSCWNYYKNPSEFLNWLDKTARLTRLLNPLEVVRWNMHKGYLRELGERGISIIPTTWVSKGSRPQFKNILEDNGWTDVVIKPAVSAGSFQTRRFRADEVEAGQLFIDELCTDRDMMIQRYMNSIENEGEQALVWIAKQWTHAVRKDPRFSDNEEQVSEALVISSEEQAFAEKILAGIDADLLYARVDLIRDTDGELCLSELELIEPSLFLLQFPPALKLFVGAIAENASK